MNKKVKKFLNKKNRAKVICLTAYSKNVASILDKHCDLVLVGDSLGSVLYDYKSTKEVTKSSKLALMTLVLTFFISSVFLSDFLMSDFFCYYLLTL